MNQHRFNLTATGNDLSESIITLGLWLCGLCGIIQYLATLIWLT